MARERLVNVDFKKKRKLGEIIKALFLQKHNHIYVLDEQVTAGRAWLLLFHVTPENDGNSRFIRKSCALWKGCGRKAQLF